ncbi:MAG TPA: Hsp70 family protein, partial [bacterium]|nr:Hsp70 family protein [bacterium]
MGEGAVVGIDLGTTYSVCAIVENGRPRVISDTGGSFTIPSIVAVDDKGNRLVGQAAKRQSMINPINTIYGSKRLVGRDIHSPIIDEIQDHFKYRIAEGDQDDVRIRLRKEDYALEEIQAMILDHIRNTAQDMLGREITKAVVTVPAYFNDRQRHAVREAGRVAQMEVLRIINEPTAAALA